MSKLLIKTATSSKTSLQLLGLMFFIPFIFGYHQPPIPVFYSEWLAATLGLLALITLTRISNWQSLQIPKVSLVFLGLAIILLLQWMFGMLQSNSYALLWLSYIGWAFFLIILGCHLRHELGWEHLVNILARYLVLGGLLNVIYIGLQYALRSGIEIPLLEYNPTFGAVAQANHFADYMALATTSVLYLFARAHISIKLFIPITFSFLVTLAFTGSRSSWLYLASIIALTIYLQIAPNGLAQNLSAKRKLLYASLVLIPAFIALQFIISYILADNIVTLPNERLFSPNVSNGFSTRLPLWYDSLRLFMQSPWLGIGAGTMRAETFSLVDIPTKMAAGRVFENSHNIFIHILTEMGIGGFLLLLAGITVWLSSFRWKKLNIETWWLISLISILGIHCMLEYPFWFTYFLGIVSVLLGASGENNACIQLKNIFPNLSDKFNPIIKTTFIFLLLLGLVNLSTLLVANIKLEHWLTKTSGEINSQHELDWVQRYSLLSPYAELLSALSMKINKNNIKNQLLINQSAMKFIPLRKVVYQQALLLKLKGDHIAAVKQLERALIVYPNNQETILELIPIEYREVFLDLLSETSPSPIKENIQ